MKHCPVCNTEVEDLYTGLCPEPYKACPWEFEFTSAMTPNLICQYEEKLERAKLIYRNRQKVINSTGSETIPSGNKQSSDVNSNISGGVDNFIYKGVIKDYCNSLLFPQVSLSDFNVNIYPVNQLCEKLAKQERIVVRNPLFHYDFLYFYRLTLSSVKKLIVYGDFLRDRYLGAFLNPILSEKRKVDYPNLEILDLRYVDTYRMNWNPAYPIVLRELFPNLKAVLVKEMDLFSDVDFPSNHNLESYLIKKKNFVQYRREFEKIGVSIQFIETSDVSTSHENPEIGDFGYGGRIVSSNNGHLLIVTAHCIGSGDFSLAKRLTKKLYNGYRDWRLPTLSEARENKIIQSISSNSDFWTNDTKFLSDTVNTYQGSAFKENNLNVILVRDMYIHLNGNNPLN